MQRNIFKLSFTYDGDKKKTILRKYIPPLLTQQISTETMPEILEREFFFFLLPPSFLSFLHLSSYIGLFTDIVF